MSQPKISILTTVYNREKYLAACIESVLASTFNDWELLIVDDGSSDASVRIAKQYEVLDSRIRVYVNRTNLGQFENRNYAATLARGTYLKYLDSDDSIYPHGLEVMVRAAEQFPKAGLIISHDRLHEEAPYPIEMSSEEACQAFYFNKGFPASGPTSALIKRSIFEQVNGFPKPYYVGTDLLLWLKIAQISSIVKIPPALNWYRQHDGQAISAGITSNEYLKLDYFYFQQYLSDPSTKLTPANKVTALALLKKRQLRNIIRYALKTGRFVDAFSILRYNQLGLSDLKYIL